MTNKIDLTNAVVGDKFNSDGKGGYTVVIMGSADIVMLSDNGTHYSIQFDGEFSDYNDCRITSKVDTRHWLKYMPDADDFLDTVEFLEFDNMKGMWYVYIEGCGLQSYVTFLKMPKLTPNESRSSRIYIDDLRNWQKENK